MLSSKFGNFGMNVEVYPGLVPLDTIFIHGNLASNRWWSPSLELLKQSSTPANEGRVILAEWRGCGRSRHVSDERQLNMKEMASDYVAMMREFGVSKACVVAHSTGGIIALYAMLEAPDLFDRAVLLNPVGPTGVQFGAEMYDVFTQMSKDRSVCAQVLSATIHGNDPTNALFQKLVDDAYGIGHANWHGVPRALAEIEISNEVTRLEQPVLVLHGEHDPVLPIAGSIELAERLPNSKFHEMKGQGHSANIENPELFMKLTTDFLFKRN